VNITTITNAPIPPDFVTIPQKIHDAYFISPTLSKNVTPATNNKQPSKTVKPKSSNNATIIQEHNSPKKRAAVKNSDQKKKRTIPAKTAQHSKQPSLNTSIGELLKNPKVTITNDQNSVKPTKEFVFFM